MGRWKQIGSFLTGLLINMLLNLEWSIPAWILLGLHAWLGIRIRWFAAAMILWILRVLAGMWLMGWASSCGSRKDPPKENKNPYSVKTNRNEQKSILRIF